VYNRKYLQDGKDIVNEDSIERTRLYLWPGNAEAADSDRSDARATGRLSGCLRASGERMGGRGYLNTVQIRRICPPNA
jgi:hypothetical protein